MYYNNVPSIIESDDILNVQSMQVDAPDETGRVFAHIVLELSPAKQYTASPSLHVTNGVDQRLLSAPPISLVLPIIPGFPGSGLSGRQGDLPVEDQGQAMQSDETPTTGKGKRSGTQQMSEAGGGM